MKGKDIKDILAGHGIMQSELAKVLGISAANLNNMLAKDDIRTGLLESISEATNIPISVFYGDAYNVTGNNNATGSHNVVNATDDRLLSLLIAKDEQLTLSMKQTTTAQEQMSRILDKFCR